MTENVTNTKSNLHLTNRNKNLVDLKSSLRYSRVSEGDAGIKIHLPGNEPYTGRATIFILKFGFESNLHQTLQCINQYVGVVSHYRR